MKSRLGFTLVELMVAIAIFAVLSALGWKIFDYVVKVKDRNAQHELQLSELQQAYQQILNDTMQIVPLNASIRQELEPALALDNNHIRFSKTGVSDPLQQGLPSDERIEYRYQADEKKLYRLKYVDLNHNAAVQPLSSVLLEHVDAFELAALNPEAEDTWPTTQTDRQDPQLLQVLPKGLEIQLVVAGESYLWIYPLLQQQDAVAAGVLP